MWRQGKRISKQVPYSHIQYFSHIANHCAIIVVLRIFCTHITSFHTE